MDIEDNHSSDNSVKTPRKPELLEAESQQSNKDIFEDMLAESQELKVQQQFRNIFTRPSRKHTSKKIDMRKILNSSSSNQRLPSSLKNDSSSLQHSDRPRNLYETENSMDEESFRTSFKKRYEESFSVENTIRDSSSSFSQRSDSKSNQNLNILRSVYKDQQVQEPKKPGCNCKRSKCLKLYCECFQKRLFCTQNCNCHDCGNCMENKEQHKQAVIEALARNARGFEEDDKAKIETPQQKGFSLGVQIEEVKKGCKCRKTHCIKKYCECYQNGSQCGIFCRCEDCFNTNFHIKNES